MIQYPEILPISKHHDEIIELINENQVVIIAGDTGSGKTTQIPKMCLEIFKNSKKTIGCTQPRRIAAVSIATRVAEELEELGNIVASKIRFQDRTDKNTRIKFMTDGILLAETRSNPLLDGYDVLIIDEAHERSLNIDFILGYIKNILKKRSDLKIIVCSATIDTDKFSEFYDDAPVLQIAGKTYPVALEYNPHEEDNETTYIDHCVDTIVDINLTKPPGDILVFLPTEKDIRRCCEILEKRLSNCQILPMFGRLQAKDQQKIFRQSHAVKIVVATNVAETSVTVPGIRYVVDTGLARISQYNHRAKTTSLPIKRVSRASCDQRKGRCGRVGPGLCIRLYSEEDYNQRTEFTIPEIKRSNLADIILQMTNLNLGSIYNFPFIEPPAKQTIKDGYKLLEELGALTDRNRQKLSKTGKIMARLPIDPCIGRIIIEAKKLNCLKEIKIIGSSLAIQDPRVRPASKEKEADFAHSKLADKHSDFISLLNIWDKIHDSNGKRISWSKLKKFCNNYYFSFQRVREWLDLHEQMERILEQVPGFTTNIKDANPSSVHKSIITGFVRNLAQKKSKKIYQAAWDKEIMIFPGSDQFSSSGQWIVAASFLETNRLYALTIATIDPEWIEPIAKHLCKYSYSDPHWQKKTGQIVANEKATLFGLIINNGKKVNYGRINPKHRPEARKIFINDALMKNNITGYFSFLEHNIELINHWQKTEERLRKRDLVVDDSIIFEFYDSALPANIYDRFTLNRWLKQNKDNADTLLKMTKNDIVNRQPESNEMANFPPSISINNFKLKLTYCFEPGSKNDGISVLIPSDIINYLKPTPFDWLVPGLLPEKITYLLKGLPKRLRKHLVPIKNTVDLLLDDLDHYKTELLPSLEQSILKSFKINIHRNDWPQQLPEHLLMKFILVDSRTKKEINHSHNFSELLKLPTMSKSVDITKAHPNKQDNAKIKILSSQITDTLPEFIPNQVPIYIKKELKGYLFPLIITHPNRGGISIKFINDQKKALEQNVTGLAFVYRLQFKQQFKNLKKLCKQSLSAPSAVYLKSLIKQINLDQTTTISGPEILSNLIIAKLFNIKPGPLPSKKESDEIINSAKEIGIYKKGKEICEQLMRVLRLRQEVAEKISHFSQIDKRNNAFHKSRYDEYSQLLEAFFINDFGIMSFISELSDLERYLKGLILRIDRAHINPNKDDSKAKPINKHMSNLSTLQKNYKKMTPDEQSLYKKYIQLINEFRLSVFAPEVRTNGKVSDKKLNDLWKLLS